MSSFLMCSNLVFPLSHVNILISAELSLFSSFFFTAQHSEPYVIAGLMIVWRLCLLIPQASSYCTSPRILPESPSFHFIHPIYVFHYWHQPLNLPHSWTVTRGIWRMSLWAVRPRTIISVIILTIFPQRQDIACNPTGREEQLMFVIQAL